MPEQKVDKRNNRAREVDMCAALAHAYPNERHLIPKSTKDPAEALARALRIAGVPATVRGRTFVDTKGRSAQRYIVMYGIGVDMPVRLETIKPKDPIVPKIKAAPKAKAIPDMVVADRLEDAVAYCRQKGWNASKLAASRFDSDYQSRLAAFINPRIVDLGH